MTWKKKIINFFFPLILILLFISPEREENGINFLEDIGSKLDIKFTNNGKLYIYNNKFCIKKFDIKILYNSISKQNGIKYISNINNNQGILIIYDNKYEYKKIIKHIKMSVDILFISKINNKIIKIDPFINSEIELNNDIINNIDNNIGYILIINSGLSEKLKIKENQNIIRLYF